MRWLVVLVVAGCGDGGLVFTATVTTPQLDATGNMDLAPGAIISSTTTSFSIEGADLGAPCEHHVEISVPAPLATKTYDLGDRTGGSSAGYYDCYLNAYRPSYAGVLDVTRADTDCGRPPCIEATFGFSVSEAVPNAELFAVQIQGGHISNY